MNIGIPEGHPLSNMGQQRQGNSGNNNGEQPNGGFSMGGINIPPPQYVFINRGREGEQQNREQPNVENIVNDLLRSFMDIFTGHEFLRMRAQYSDFNPNDFMNNFQ